jgi:hypothetical protein
LTKPTEFKVNRPECERARELAHQAKKAVDAEELTSAISLIEEAIKLDPIASLNGYHSMREELCTQVGQDAPQKASELYNYAIQIKKNGRYRDAAIAYQEAAALDPLFLWPLNNLAWMLATSKERSVRNGKEAVKYATEACEKSNWSCWAFLGTLAAAYAEAGDFERAVGWQQASLELVPEEHRLDQELMLKHFKRHQAYVDEGQPVAAGGSGDEGDGPKHLFRPENTTIEAMQELFQEAYLETAFDDEHDLWVSGDVKVMVRVVNKGSQIAFTAYAQPSRNASLKERLQFVNRVNSSINVVRASVAENGMVIFDYSLPVVGGITKQAVVFALRYFMGATAHAKEECDTDGIFAAKSPGKISFSEN